LAGGEEDTELPPHISIHKATRTSFNHVCNNCAQRRFLGLTFTPPAARWLPILSGTMRV
jgi:hypothetical protein